MNKEELMEIAAKVKNNTASDEEKISFFKGLNDLVDEINSDIANNNS